MTRSENKVKGTFYICKSKQKGEEVAYISHDYCKMLVDKINDLLMAIELETRHGLENFVFIRTIEQDLARSMDHQNLSSTWRNYANKQRRFDRDFTICQKEQRVQEIRS